MYKTVSSRTRNRIYNYGLSNTDPRTPFLKNFLLQTSYSAKNQIMVYSQPVNGYTIPPIEFALNHLKRSLKDATLVIIPYLTYIKALI